MSLLRASRFGVHTWTRSIFSRGWTSSTPTFSSPSMVTEPRAVSTSANTNANDPTSAMNASDVGVSERDERGIVVDKLSPDAWTGNQPTRYIAHKLLDRDKHMCGLRELYESVQASGLFKSKRHFKQCLKLMRKKNRVQVICQGPVRVGSSNLQFAVKLTGKGQRTYLWFRQSYRSFVAKEAAENGLNTNSTAPGGLKDAL